MGTSADRHGAGERMEPGKTKEETVLVLMREEGERLLIGDDIIVDVVRIRTHSVRLGVTAPPFIPVHRQEVYERIGNKTKATLVPLPVDVASQVERQASLAGMTPEHYLSLIVGIGLANARQTA